ncbi:SpoIIE family protein phosphatase [Streptomyces sp. NPDC004376]
MAVLLDGHKDESGGRAALSAAASALSRKFQGLTSGALAITDPPFVLSTPPPSIMDADLVGTFDWNIRTGQLILDERALRALGLDPLTFDYRYETWARMVHPNDLSAAPVSIEPFGRYDSEYRFTGRAGDTRWVRASGLVLPGPGARPARMVGTLFDATESHLARGDAAYGYGQSEGLVLTGDGGVIIYVDSQAERLLRTSRSDLLGRRVWAALPYQGQPGLETRCREAAAAGEVAQSDMYVPALGAWYRLAITPRDDILALSLSDVTEARLRAAERARVERVAFLRTTHTQELTAALSEAVSVKDVVSAVADHLIAPFGARRMAVQNLEGSRLRVVGKVGYSDAFVDVLDSTLLTERSPSADSLRTRSPIYIGSPGEYASLYPHLQWRIEPSGMQSWAFLPLIASGRAIGCCSIAFPEPGDLDEDERTLLAALSGLVAHALERARLYDAEHTRAVELQRGLLPHSLPELPGVVTAVRYLPASEGMEVGGDWYDVIPLSGSRVALVIGDVMGHGLPEAATMGRVRTAVQTLADLELTLEDLLTQLNDLVGRLSDDFYATFLCAIYDPTTYTATFARAGHPPPALVDASGNISVLDLPNNPPLGVGTPPFETKELELPAHSVLVFYTDGLVEAHDRDIDSGINALTSTLSRALADPLSSTATAAGLDRLCAAVTTALTDPQGTEDDAVLFLAGMRGLPSEQVADWMLTDRPIAAGEARALVAAQLGAWGLGPLVDVTELLVSELVTNAVRHARGPVRLRLICSGSLVCEVSDGSTTVPRVRRAADTDEGGRGLAMVTLLAQRWGTRHSVHGKTIWAEQPLPSTPGK